MPARLRHTLVVASLLLLAIPALHADEGWIIRHMDVRLEIQPDGSLKVVDALDVDAPPRPGLYDDRSYALLLERLGEDDPRRSLQER